jgi:ferrous iron transport protein B
MSLPSQTAAAKTGIFPLVAICGNPNCGKTTIFNALTGLRQKVANYPGVTVEKTIGQFKSADGRTLDIIDIPGAYSLAAFSPDEYIAAQALFGNLEENRSPDVIVCIVDATNLERGLYLLFQVMQIGKPIVLGLNMIDLSEKQGSVVDPQELSRQLGGLPVVPLVGSKGRGIPELKNEIAELLASPRVASPDIYHPATLSAITRLQKVIPGSGSQNRAEYVRVLFDVKGPAERLFVRESGKKGIETLAEVRSELAEQFGTLMSAETIALTQSAVAIAAASITDPAKRIRTFSDKLDRFLLHPLFGPLILLIVVAFIFQSIFSWAAPLMNLIDHAFGHLAEFATGGMSDGPLRSLLVDGVIGGVGSVLVFLPQIIILFLFISFLEDSGYMPRVAFLVDRAFSWCGLSGKSFIPLLSSFACAVPGIMATRTIEDKKLRFITILVAPLMTCSARLPVYAIMIAAFIPPKQVFGIFSNHGLLLCSLYGLGLVVAVIVSLLLKKTLLKTQRGTFMMEMPSYKLPTLQSVLIRVFNRAKAFVLRAGTVIMAITVLIWALSYYPRSESIANDYKQRIEILKATPDGSTNADLAAQVRALENEKAGAQLRNSYLGRIGQAVEPVFRPLGWDWKITMATLASFPAREVIIATLGTIYNLGSDVDDSSGSLVGKMRQAKWESGPRIGQTVFGPAVALSIMVFFALCCQCGATVVTIRQETGSWKYAAGVFAYMTVMAYIGSLVVYQIASRLGA